MSRRVTLPEVDETTLAELRQRYNSAPQADQRQRYQMILWAYQGYAIGEMARLMFCSRDTVERVLKRFRSGGLAAVPKRTSPGVAPTVTSAWVNELLRVIDLDPHEVGVESANWTTGRLANYLAGQTGMAVSDETVRLYLHAHGYVCKRPTWTLKRKAEEQPDYVGKG